jgi:tetratricopeptide (TPR) repeat protein
VEDHVQRGRLYEQQGQYEPAINAYQCALEVDGENLEAAQRLAFLLEKLNRDAEAAALWDRIWAMRDAQATNRRRRLR